MYGISDYGTTYSALVPDDVSGVVSLYDNLCEASLVPPPLYRVRVDPASAVGDYSYPNFKAAYYRTYINDHHWVVSRPGGTILFKGGTHSAGLSKLYGFPGSTPLLLKA